MKRNWLNYLPTIFVICIIVSLLAYNVQGNTVQMNYTQFESLSKHATFDDSSLDINDTVITVSGTYDDTHKKGHDPVEYSVIVPNTDENINWLKETLSKDGGSITINNPHSGDIWVNLLAQFLPFLIVAIFFYYMFSRMGGGSSQNKAFEFAKSRANMEQNVKTRFKDVAGCEEEKEEVKEIIDYLQSPKKFTDMGAHIPKGILMVGPPGTGKTLLAKAVAGEANVPFFSISGSDFVEMFVGTGASRVRDMFKNVQKAAPCIIFIDEIDAVGRQRGAGMGGGNDEREQTLNQLLVEMDGMTDNSGIVVIAATNRPDILDPALLRSGRFDRRITVTLPDIRGREEILKVHARNKKLAPDVSLHNLAQRCPGFSGADLANVLNEGAILAVRNKEHQITMDDLDEAIDRVMMGPAKKSKKYNEMDKKLVAYHEAGHAVIGLKLEDAEKVQKVTIIPRGEAGGYNLMTPKEEKYFHRKSELLAQITGLLGGRTAEELVYGEVSAGAVNDIEQLTKIAKNMVRVYGMSSLGPIQYADPQGNVFLGRDYTQGGSYSEGVAGEIDKEVREIVHQCEVKCRKILTDNRNLLDLIAKNLYEHETLTNEEIMNLMNYGELKNPNQKVDEPSLPPVPDQTTEKQEPEKEEKEEDEPKGIDQKDLDDAFNELTKRKD